MSRPLRIEFPGALYHVTSRGDRKEAIYDDDRDRYQFLEILGDTASIYNWGVLAYCLMGNHYHLVVRTPDANLSGGMRHLNGVFTQASNRRHNRSGHLFQGRYKAILVDEDAYLLELSRYVVLNPVRAGLVHTPQEWPWSSYLPTLRPRTAPEWLLTHDLLAQFSLDPGKAVKKYLEFVCAGIGKNNLWGDIRQQIYLGNQGFVESILARKIDIPHDCDVPLLQKRPPAPSLLTITEQLPDRNKAIIRAYETGEYSYREIGEFFGIHFTTVGHIVRGSRTKL